MLSRLVEGAKRPDLTRAGSCVKALWLAIHGLNPALSAGEFVIMPDHVHLLLIVNYDRDPDFRPLVFLHWFMEESARMIAVVTKDGGKAPEPPLPTAIRATYRSGACGGKAPEPPLPTAIRATYRSGAYGGKAPDPPLPTAIRATYRSGACGGKAPEPPLPAAIRATYRSGACGGKAPEPPLPTAIRATYRSGACGGSGAQSPSFAAFWEDRFWLDLSFDARQLAAIRRYIRGNPVRALWKRLHPDRFACHPRIRHRILDPDLTWSACGELTLLASPFLLAVSLTRRKTLAEHEPEIAALVEKARQGWIIVCGFLSPGEKELARRLREEPRTRWIKTIAQGLPPRYDPSFADSRELAAGRLLILSALPLGAPFDWNSCHKMNALAAEMCRRARGEI